MSTRTPPPNAILEEAAEWMMRFREGPLDLREAAALEAWKARSPEHRQAWSRARKLLRGLDTLSPAAAISAPDRPDSPGRRVAVAQLALLLAAAPAGWAAWEFGGNDAMRYDHATRIDEIETVRLPDGSSVTLNNESAVDIAMTAETRRISLRRGEVYIETASDAAKRPFEVDTAEGRLRALGTRFVVRQSKDLSRLAVLEGAVLASPLRGEGRIVKRGRQASFTVDEVGDVAAADARVASWSKGMLAANALPLGDVVSALDRYRRGHLRIEPAAARLQVSGAFPLTDVDAALDMLAATYPIVIDHAAFGLIAKISLR